MGDLGPGWALTGVPGLGSSPGITTAGPGPWGSPFTALSLTFLSRQMGETQPCPRGLCEEDLVGPGWRMCP